MQRILLRLAALAITVVGCISCGQSSVERDERSLSPEEVDTTVEQLMIANDVKGLAVVLIHDGEITLSKAYGYRMVEKELPLAMDTIIYGASLTKATFAYFVMQLVDEGLIDLDQPIPKYLPRPLPAYEHYRDLANDERWRGLTMRNLLSHTSGFANFRWLDPAGDDKLRFHFTPGSRYSYSGEGLVLAQFILEEGLGLNVGSEMQARIFNRFGMTKTSMVWREDFRENYSHNYDIAGENIRHRIQEDVNAAGSLDTTPGDWSKFLAAVVRGDGLSQQSKREMISPQIRIQSKTQFPTLQDQTTALFDHINLSYGLGWGLFDSDRGRAFFKEGHDDGTANYALCMEREASCILLMSNSVRAERIFANVVESLFGQTSSPWQWHGYTSPGNGNQP